LSASSYFIWGQNIEGQNLQRFAKGTASSKPFSLSFWVKAFQTGTYVAELYDNTNSRQVTKTFTINASATWEYKTIQFPADATGAFANSNANAFSLWFWLVGGTTFTSGTASGSWATASNANRAAGLTVNGASSTSNYFQFTGVQLEANTQATAFEQLPYTFKMSLCQRYYTVFEARRLNSEGYASSSGYGYYSNVGFPSEMRVAPTITLPAATQSGNTTGIATSSSVDGIVYFFGSAAAGNAYVLWNAGLKATASAEF
jgi:hypothetical protein